MASVTLCLLLKNNRPELKDNQKNELRLDNAIKMCSKLGVSIGSAFSLMYSNSIGEDDPLFWAKLSWSYKCFPILVMIALLLDGRTLDELPVIRNSYQKYLDIQYHWKTINI